MTVVLVDWLGRGGIAQMTETWARVTSDLGVGVIVVTRSHRDLRTVAAPVTVVEATGRRGRLGSHLEVISAAERVIHETAPRTVVVQNYVAPVLEMKVAAAVKRVGAQLVLVVHDDRLHSPLAGTTVGLAQLVGRARYVVAHSDFVAERLRQRYRAHVEVVPHPVPLGLISEPGRKAAAAVSGPPAAIHFGVVKRRYKGTAMVDQVAGPLLERGWRVTIAGNGARTEVEGVRVVSGYLPADRLVAEVGRSHVSLLPYRFATQSGAVVLAKVLGSVPVASAVGGIPEQIVDGETGVLVQPGVGADGWLQCLRRLEDDDVRRRIAERGQVNAWDDHQTFIDRTTRLLG